MTILSDFEKVSLRLIYPFLIFLQTNLIASTPDAQRINQALGFPIFPEEKPESLWQTDAASLAEKLALPPESKTTYSSSFRSYQPTQVLGRTAYSIALHAQNEKPASIAFVFANKGDIELMFADRQPPRTVAGQVAFTQKIQSDYKRFILEDSKQIQKQLTALFGQPKFIRIGDSPKSSESVRLWQWQKTAFLLSAPREQYVMLRLLPADAIDSRGIERIPRSDLANQLSQRVVRQPNGDVIISDIPMVNQGPKGFCAPATAERFLRYMGIPADLYVLSMAADTELGGGTMLNNLIGGIQLLVQRYGRRIQRDNKPTSIKTIAPYIDKGIPILWGMLSTEQFNKLADELTRQRAEVSDWKQWVDQITQIAKNVPKLLLLDPESAHVCLIIGYNPLTRELAISDSWGPEYELRWIPEQVASYVSFNNHIIILP